MMASGAFFLRLCLLLLLSIVLSTVSAFEPPPPGLTPEQLLEIEQARAAALAAVAPEDTEVALDANGDPYIPSDSRFAHIETLKKAHTTDLLMAAMAGDMELMESALQNGALLSSEDAMGRCALTLAAMNGRVAMVAHLLSLGAPKDLKDHNGLTALELTRMLASEARDEGEQGRAALLAQVEAALLAPASAASE
jgi:hypothetical protein